MLKSYCKRFLGDHLAAIAGALAVHFAVVAWALQPAAPIVMKQQVIKISMVAPSSDAPKQQSMLQQELAMLAPPSETGTKVAKRIQKQPEPQKQTQEKEVEKTAEQQQTSGLQAPDATDQVAAHSEPISNAVSFYNPPPSYPSLARSKNIQGKVMLTVAVNTDGNASDVAIDESSGSSLLDEAARDAVRLWRFVPARRGSEIVEARVLVPVADSSESMIASVWSMTALETSLTSALVG